MKALRARFKMLTARVLSPDSPTWCSAQSACHGCRLRAKRGGPVRRHPRRSILKRTLRSRGIATILIWAALGAGVWACPVCFRMDEGPVTDGVRAAVVVLMGVTTTVLAGFAVFIRGFIRRARAVELENR